MGMQVRRWGMNTVRDVSIIIVNYNRYKLTEKCVESVILNLNTLNYEIIIMDNCSNNDSFSILKEKYNNIDNVRVERSIVNDGFGDGNNKAVRLAKYDRILFLNPDVIVFDDSIEKMIDKLEESEDNGIVGCKLLNGDKTLQYSCRRFISFKNFIIARTPLKKLFSKTKVEKINADYLMKDYDHIIERNVDWIMGSCILIRKSDFNSVGGFSKEYFMYFEDVDLCFKIKQNNKRVIYLATAEMIHLHEQESVKKLNKLSFIHFSSMMKFYKKFKECM